MHEARLGRCKIVDLCTCTARILEVYIEAVTGLSHVHHADGLNTTLVSQGCILGQLLGVRK